MLGAMVFFLAGCGSGEENLFAEIPSPDGAYVLRITVAEPRLPQGPFYVRAYLSEAGGSAEHRVLEEKLENDGVPFTRKNLAGRWTDRATVLLCLRATDRPDRGFRIRAGDPPEVVEVRHC